MKRAFNPLRLNKRTRPWALVFLCAIFALCSCATSGKVDSSKAQRKLPSTLTQESVPLLQALIRTKPVNPGGDTSVAVALLAARLDAAGVAYEVHPYGMGTRANLLAKVGPKTGRPLLITHHIDVVPADASEWKRDPYSGELIEGIVYGRGAVDDLNRAVLDTLAMVDLAERFKRDPTSLSRPVWMLAVSDEETTGEGMKQALRHWPALKESVLAFGEGAYVFDGLFAPGKNLIGISTAEKGLFQFRLSVQGRSGHGSRPSDADAPARLVRAVDRILSREKKARLTPAVKESAFYAASIKVGKAAFLLKTPGLLRAVAPGVFEKQGLGALVYDSCALTILKAGYKVNVIPNSASAEFDCRILPGTKLGEFKAKMRKIIDDEGVKMTMIQQNPANDSPRVKSVFEVIEKRIARDMFIDESVAVLLPAVTDNRFLRLSGVQTLGFSPLLLNAEELASVHGKDERVRAAELEDAVPRWADIVREIAQLSDEELTLR